MCRFISAILWCQCFLIITSVFGHNYQQEKKFLNGFKEYLNNLPNQPYFYEDGLLLHAENTEENFYKIEVSLKVSELNKSKSFKLLRCTAVVEEYIDGITVVDKSNECHEDVVIRSQESYDVEDVSVGEESALTEPPVQVVFVKLRNEVESDTTATTSGERFVAVRRGGGGGCGGGEGSCGGGGEGGEGAVDVTAPGVRELAQLGVAHLDRHEFGVEHTLLQVLSVHRQVQVVNGVRYTLVLQISYNNCSRQPGAAARAGCSGVHTCKVTVLEKPWAKLSDGSKFRAILSNNCTEDWIFDEEIVSGNPNDDQQNKDVVKVVHNLDSQAPQPTTERTLTDDELKLLQEQIIVEPEAQPGSGPERALSSSDAWPSAHFDVWSAQEAAPGPAPGPAPALDPAPAQNSRREPALEVPAPTPSTLCTNHTSNELLNVQQHRELNNFTLTADQKSAIDDLMGFSNSESDSANKGHTREKRHTGGAVLGAAMQRDPTAPRYAALAADALRQWQSESSSTSPSPSLAYSVLAVRQVTEQLVSGTLTVIDFDIAPTVRGDGDHFNCLAKVWEQAWNKFKEIKVTCKPSNIIVKKLKRDVSEAPSDGIGIDFRDRDVERDDALDADLALLDSKYQKLAEECMKQYLHQSDKTSEYKVIALDEVRALPTGGGITRLQFRIAPARGGGTILRCLADVWEKPALSFRDLDVNCSLGAQAPTPPPAPSAPVTKDPADARYRALADESLLKYLKLANRSEPCRVAAVQNASVQVVAGTLTRLAFTVLPTDGVRRDLVACTSEVWEKPWMNFRNFKVDCQFDRVKRSMKTHPTKNKKKKVEAARVEESTERGPVEHSATEPRYRLLAEEAMRQHLAVRGDVREHRVLAVDHVAEQRVAGALTKLDFRISPLGGKRGDTVNCYAEVWVKAWLNFKQIKVECNEKKRVDPGVSVEKDVTDPKYQSVAEEALQQWAETQGARWTELGGRLRVVGVRRVVAQAMAGTVTRILFDAAPDDDQAEKTTLDCRAEVWEKPWIYFKKIDVDCNTIEAAVSHRPLHRHKRKDVHDLEPDAPEDPDVGDGANHETEEQRALALEALRRWQGRDRARHAHRLMNVTRAERAPRAPLLLHFTAARTRCAADVTAAAAAACRLQRPKVLLYCRAMVFLRVWTDGYKDMSVECSDKPLRDPPHNDRPHDWMLDFGNQKRSPDEDTTTPAAGAEVVGELSAEGAAQAAVEQLNAQKKLRRSRLRVTRVLRSSGRAAAGRVLTVHFEAAYTQCREDEPAECPALPGLPVRRCSVRVYVRAWLRGGRYLDVSCDAERAPPAEFPASSFAAAPAPAEVDASNTTLQLAEEALRHIEAKYPHPRRQRVVRVLSLQRQQVAGEHYRLKLEVGFTTCPALSVAAPSACPAAAPGVAGVNKLCRVNVWVKAAGAGHEAESPPPAVWRVSCEDGEDDMRELHAQQQVEQLFAEFVATYNRPYAADRAETARRFLVFKENVRRIHELNTHERGTARYAVTRFADLTREEFARRHLGLRASGRRDEAPAGSPVPAPAPAQTLPDAWDWRSRGVVTDVKNQGSCGSCWAFSVTGNVEGQLALKSGRLVSLSEQELVDCDALDHGCDGGLPDNAYRAIETLGGLEAEADYPYEGADEKCAFNRSLARVRLRGAVNISRNEDEMASWLVQNGPISIGINANAMQFYVGGISHPFKVLCNPSNLDHGVLIVGYGVKNYPLFKKRLPYWIVKNSWGARWGEQGYYRVYRGDGTCGLNLMASSAVL